MLFRILVPCKITSLNNQSAASYESLVLRLKQGLSLFSWPALAATASASIRSGCAIWQLASGGSRTPLASVPRPLWWCCALPKSAVPPPRFLWCGRNQWLGIQCWCREGDPLGYHKWRTHWRQDSKCTSSRGSSFSLCAFYHNKRSP